MQRVNDARREMDLVWTGEKLWNSYLCGLEMPDSYLELNALKQAVESKYALRLSTSADFVALSEDMQAMLGKTVSPSTLKRLWGYVSMEVKPRKWTLDVLAQYSGFANYRAFLSDFKAGRQPSSSYFNVDHIDSSKLKKGARISLGWKPDRELGLEYLGDMRYRVLESRNSLLREGDEFEAVTIMKGFPLYLAGVWRDGAWTDPYVAGRDGGIIFLKKQ